MGTDNSCLPSNTYDDIKFPQCAACLPLLVARNYLVTVVSTNFTSGKGSYVFSPQEKKNKIIKYHFDDQEEPLDFGQGSQIQRPTNIKQVISMREAE